MFCMQDYLMNVTARLKECFHSNAAVTEQAVKYFLKSIAPLGRLPT